MVRQPSSAENGFIEMDFNEGHYPYEIATNLHRSIGSGTVTTQNSIKHYPLGNTEGSETLADNFNRYTGMLVENDWNYTWDSQQNSDTYQVFFNNELLRKTRSLQYTASPVSIFFSVAVYPGTFTGPLVDEDADGSVMEVDWVRYYEFLGTTEAELDAEIMKAEGYLRDAVVGDQTGNYPQQSVDELRAAVETARSVLGTGAETEALDDALDALKAAEGIFLRSVVGGYYVNVESISFDEKEVSILIEKTKKLNVNVYPEDANNKNVKFTSSSANVASVSADGVLTALSPGTTVITAETEDGGFEAQCTVTVTDLPDNQVFYEVEGGKLIFDKDKKEIIDYVGSPTVIVIPSRIENVKVEGIAINTFKELTTLKELRIKKGLQSIGDWSFSLCPKLEKVTFNGNAPEETGRFIFGDDNNVTVYFYKGAQGFTTPEWNGYSAVEMDGEPIPIPEPVLTSIELTGGRDSAVRGFTLTPFTARAYDDIGDEITDIDFVWSVTGNATVDNGIVTISENAKNGETVIVKAEGTYNGKTMSAEKTITIGDTLKFSFGNEYIKIKPFLPGSMAETAIADTGITTTVTVSKSTNYSNVEIMNRDTKAQSGYYPFKDGLPGNFYYLFISGEGKNELKLPYTVRAGETIRIKFAKPYATNNGTKNRSEVNNKLDLTIGSETYSLKDNCDFDTWYTKDFVVDADTNMMTISMGTWSAITIESIEILVNGSDEEPIETGFSSVEYHDGTAEIEFYAPGGVLLIAAYDTDGRLLKTALCQSSEWTKDGEIRRLPFHIRCFRQ